jgi:hypothetical protein
MRSQTSATIVAQLPGGARPGGAAVIGAMRTIDALEHDMIRELLLTRRFVELNPDLAMKAAYLGSAHGVRTTTITGLAALELDLAGGGIGAVLRRCRRMPRNHGELPTITRQ